MTEWTVRDDCKAVLLAPGNHSVLDRPFLQMIENLVAGGATFVGDRLRFSYVGDIEVAHTPSENFAVALKLLKTPNCVRQRVMTALV